MPISSVAVSAHVPDPWEEADEDEGPSGSETSGSDEGSGSEGSDEEESDGASEDEVCI